MFQGLKCGPLASVCISHGQHPSFAQQLTALLIVCLLTPVIIFLVFLDTCFGVLPVFRINCMVWASGVFSAQYLSHLLVIAPCCHFGMSPPDSVVLLGL